jgi:hypothetical protein
LSSATWPKVAECGGAAVSDLLGVVGRILMSGSGPRIDAASKAELEQLAVAHGGSVVACVVDRLVRDWTSPGAAAVPERLEAASRGRDFLHEVGTVTYGP